MKSDKEFIDSVYQKIKMFDEKKSIQKKIFIPKNIYPALIAVSCIILLIFPIINKIKSSNLIDVDIASLSYDLPRSNRAIVDFSPENAIANVPIIISGKVVKINKGIYDEITNNITTNILVSPTKIYKGNMTQDDININIIGGKDTNINHFQEYEVSFKENEDILLLLNQDFNGIYTLAYGRNGKYTYLESQKDVIVYQSDDKHIITTNMIS